MADRASVQRDRVEVLGWLRLRRDDERQSVQDDEKNDEYYGRMPQHDRGWHVLVVVVVTVTVTVVVSIAVTVTVTVGKTVLVTVTVCVTVLAVGISTLIWVTWYL